MNNNKNKRYVTMGKLEAIVGIDKMPVEIESLNNDQFLKVRETLSRIGIATCINDEKILYQSCHLLSKKGKYYIVHFKHMFMLDGAFKHTKIDADDIQRVNYIANLLEAWGLIKIVNKKEVDKINVRVINYEEKDQWIIKQKYDMAKNIK